jgi:hypothetical protein
MKDPEVLGNWLAARLRYGKATSERLTQASRVDSICWFLIQVGCLAKPKDIKKFVAAFKSYRGHYKYSEPCYSLLNNCYGGVGQDFTGRSFGTWGRNENSYKHYGPTSPLYRPMPRHYAPTISGLYRAEHVQAMLDANVGQT